MLVGLVAADPRPPRAPLEVDPPGQPDADRRDQPRQRRVGGPPRHRPRERRGHPFGRHAAADRRRHLGDEHDHLRDLVLGVRRRWPGRPGDEHEAPPRLPVPPDAARRVRAADWEPHFVDYLYLSFTNATAFSPTDVMPLSRWAKLTMMLQSIDLDSSSWSSCRSGRQRPRLTAVDPARSRACTTRGQTDAVTLVAVVMGSSSDWPTMRRRRRGPRAVRRRPRGEGRLGAPDARRDVRLRRGRGRTRAAGDHRRRRRRRAPPGDARGEDDRAGARRARAERATSAVRTRCCSIVQMPARRPGRRRSRSARRAPTNAALFAVAMLAPP